MGANFKVHSYHETTVQVPSVTREGAEVMGILPCILVELVPVSDYGRSYTHESPMPSQEALVAARELFKEGNIVEMGDFKPVTEEQK